MRAVQPTGSRYPFLEGTNAKHHVPPSTPCNGLHVPSSPSPYYLLIETCLQTVKRQPCKGSYVDVPFAEEVFEKYLFGTNGGPFEGALISNRLRTPQWHVSSYMVCVWACLGACLHVCGHVLGHVCMYVGMSWGMSACMWACLHVCRHVLGDVCMYVGMSWGMCWGMLQGSYGIYACSRRLPLKPILF